MDTPLNTNVCLFILLATMAGQACAITGTAIYGECVVTDVLVTNHAYGAVSIGGLTSWRIRAKPNLGEDYLCLPEWQNNFDMPQGNPSYKLSSYQPLSPYVNHTLFSYISNSMFSLHHYRCINKRVEYSRNMYTGEYRFIYERFDCYMGASLLCGITTNRTPMYMHQINQYKGPWADGGRRMFGADGIPVCAVYDIYFHRPQKTKPSFIERIMVDEDITQSGHSTYEIVSEDGRQLYVENPTERIFVFDLQVYPSPTLITCVWGVISCPDDRLGLRRLESHRPHYTMLEYKFAVMDRAQWQWQRKPTVLFATNLTGLTFNEMQYKPLFFFPVWKKERVEGLLWLNAREAAISDSEVTNFAYWLTYDETTGRSSTDDLYKNYPFLREWLTSPIQLTATADTTGQLHLAACSDRGSNIHYVVFDRGTLAKTNTYVVAQHQTTSKDTVHPDLCTCWLLRPGGVEGMNYVELQLDQFNQPWLITSLPLLTNGDWHLAFKSIPLPQTHIATNINTRATTHR